MSTLEILEKAAARLNTGQVIAFATETVWGVGADAGNPAAISALYALKGRGENKPCQLLVAAPENAFSLGEFSPAARNLAAKHWPGALTLIVTRRRDAAVAPGISAGTATLGIRCPDHAGVQALLKAFGRPIAASSANPAGKEPALTSAQVRSYFPDIFLLEGAPAEQGLASTVVDCTGPEIKVLRQGGVMIP